MPAGFSDVPELNLKVPRRALQCRYRVRQSDAREWPGPLPAIPKRIRSLLRQPPENVAILLHDPLRNLHLGCQLRIIWDQLNAVLGLYHIESVPLVNSELFQKLFGE